MALTYMWRKFKCFVVNQPANISHDFWMLLDQVIHWYYTYILIHILQYFLKGIMHFRKSGPVFKIDLNWTPPNQILWCDPNLRAQSLPSLRTQFPEIFQNIWQVDGRCNCSMNLYVNWLELEDRQAKSPSSCKARSRSLWRWQCRSQRGRDRMGARCSLPELGCGLSASGSPRGAKPFRGKSNFILKDNCAVPLLPAGELHQDP